MLRSVVQITSLVLTLEAAIFLAHGSMGLTPHVVAELASTWMDYNPTVVHSLASQCADTRVGVVLLLVAFLLQMWNAMWPLRYKDLGGASATGMAVAIGLCMVIFIGAYWTSRSISTAEQYQVEALLRAREATPSPTQQPLR